MKTKITMLALLLFIVAKHSFAQSWKKVGNSFNSYITTLSKDKQGNLYAAGDFDTTVNNNDQYYVAKYDGIRWNNIGNSNIVFDDLAITDIKVDKNNNVYVGCYDGYTNEGFLYKYDGSNWNRCGAMGTFNGRINKIAADTFGNVYAIGNFKYDSDADGIPDLPYLMKWNGINWARQGDFPGDVSSAGISLYALATDLVGNVFVAGYMWDGAGNNLVAKWNGTSYTNISSTSLGTHSYTIVDITTDKFNNLYVPYVYYSTTYNKELTTVKKFNGTNWTSLGNLNAEGDVSNIETDDNGNTFINKENGFYNATNATNTNADFNVAKYDGTSWHKFTKNGLLGLSTVGGGSYTMTIANNKVYSAGAYQELTPGSPYAVDFYVLSYNYSCPTLAAISTTNISICTSQLPYSWNGLMFTSAGSQTAHLTNAAGCDSAATLNLSLSSSLAAIGGAPSVCIGSTILLSHSMAGGFWSSSSSSATVNQMGIVNGRNSGSLTTIKYTVAGCGSVTKIITVNAIPAVPTIGYKAPFSNPQKGAPTGGFCVGKVFGVLGAPAGGVWVTTGCITTTTGGIATINTTGAGSLTYTFTNANGCVNSKTMTGTGFVCAARGTAQINNDTQETRNDFFMYPNPAKSIVNLQVESLIGKGCIVITDLYGKTVKQQLLSMGNNTVDIANLSKGMYFISTITNERKSTKKLIVE